MCQILSITHVRQLPGSSRYIRCVGDHGEVCSWRQQPTQVLVVSVLLSGDLEAALQIAMNQKELGVPCSKQLNVEAYDTGFGDGVTEIADNTKESS